MDAALADLNWRSPSERTHMLFWLGVILLIAWIAGFGVFHVASAAIHVLIVLALISIVLHFVRGRSTV
jgi:hypothetical protein